MMNSNIKLRADALTKRASLRRMHPELQAHINLKVSKQLYFERKMETEKLYL